MEDIKAMTSYPIEQVYQRESQNNQLYTCIIVMVN